MAEGGRKPLNVLKALKDLQTGFLTPRQFQWEHEENFFRDIILKKADYNFVNIFDIERQENRYMLCGLQNGHVCIYDLKRYNDHPNRVEPIANEATPRHAHRIVHLEWYPSDDGMFIESATDHRIRIWDANRMEPVRDHSRARFHPLYRINFHNMNNSALIAVASCLNSITMIDPRVGASLHELRGHTAPVTMVRWCPSNDYLLASGSMDKQIIMWDTRSARGPLCYFDQYNAQGKEAHDFAVNNFIFTDDGLHLVSIDENRKVKMWDVSLRKNTNVNFGNFATRKAKAARRVALDIWFEGRHPILFLPIDKDLIMVDLMTGVHIETHKAPNTIIHWCQYRKHHYEVYTCGEGMFVSWTPKYSWCPGDWACSRTIQTTPKILSFIIVFLFCDTSYM